MIPQGWERTTLGRVAKITSGGTPDRNKPEYWGGDIPWVTTGEIGNGPIVSTSEHITEIGLKNSSAKLFPPGTLLMAMYGQGKTRGKVAQLKIEATTNQACAAILTKSAADASFLFQNLTARYDEIRNFSNDGSQKNLSGGLLKALPILLPPPMERERIAAITATWDRAIETVEALIANARAQKQALMQQLLPQGTTPPKKRLPGFSGEWCEAKLGSLADISKGEQKGRASLAGEGPVPVINGGITPSGYTDHPNTSADTITISEGGNSCGYVDLITQPFWCGGHCYALKNLKVERDYLFAVLKHRERQIMSLRVGSGLPNIQKKALSQFSIPVPPKSEQEKIGELAASADKEIAALEAQLTALRQEKAALMQQLLTGKRRVKLPESENA